jgi:hypothetical protein
VNQINRFDTAVSALYATVLEPNRWSDAIAGIATYFDASTACIFRYNARTQTPSDMRAFGHDMAVERRYMDFYHRLDPGRTHPE